MREALTACSAALHAGERLTLEALDFQGNVLTADTITVTNTSTAVAASAANLVLTELMYHPASPDATELAAGYTDQDEFEFVEFQNISEATVDAGGLRFDSGIEFTFPDNTLLAPGERVVVVSNPAAFQLRYAATFPSVTVAGDYAASDTLFRNSGERVRVVTSTGESILDFSYSDEAPWPESADGDGYSLVPIAPDDPNFDSTAPNHWRSSAVVGGHPGETDAYTFGEWMAANGNVNPLEDPENDGLVALSEYTTGGFPNVLDNHPDLAIDRLDPAAFSFTMAIGADDALVTAEISDDLSNWEPGSVEYTGSTNNGEGTRTLSFRQTGQAIAHFVRIRMTLR